MNENNPIYQAIDLGGGQVCDIPGVLREIDKAGFVIVPKLSLPMAVAAGAAAMIIKNPVVTRRFWSGWVR